jgi:hydrogenase maturation protein HypF
MARRRVNAPLTSSAGRLFDAVAALLGVRDEITYEGQAAIELEQLADPAETLAYRARVDASDGTGCESARSGSAGSGSAGSGSAGSGSAGSGSAGSGSAGSGSAGSESARIEAAGIEAAGIAAAVADCAGIAPGGPFRASGADLIAAVAADLAAGLPRERIAARFHNGLATLVVDGCELLRERHGLATVALSGGVFQNLLLLGRTVAGLEARGFTVLTHSRVPCNDGGISLGQAVVAAARDRQKS